MYTMYMYSVLPIYIWTQCKVWLVGVVWAEFWVHIEGLICHIKENQNLRHSCTGEGQTGPRENTQMYHVAGIFRGRKLSRIGGKWDFVEKTFVDCSLVLPTVHRAFKQSRRKLSLIGTKQ